MIKIALIPLGIILIVIGITIATNYENNKNRWQTRYDNAKKYANAGALEMTCEEFKTFLYLDFNQWFMEDRYHSRSMIYKLTATDITSYFDSYLIPCYIKNGQIYQVLMTNPEEVKKLYEFFIEVGKENEELAKNKRQRENARIQKDNYIRFLELMQENITSIKEQSNQEIEEARQINKEVRERLKRGAAKNSDNLHTKE